MLLAGRILKLRMKLGINQKQLAEASGITQATISRIESGKVKELRSEALLRLARALGVTMEYLLDPNAKLTTKDIVQSDPDAARILKLYSRLTVEQRRTFSGFLGMLTLPLQMKAWASAMGEWSEDNKELIKELFPSGLKGKHARTFMQGFDETSLDEEKKGLDGPAFPDDPFENHKNRYRRHLDKKLKDMKKKRG
jgi:transcriptional regulator with XRE-family HTH domain